VTRRKYRLINIGNAHSYGSITDRTPSKTRKRAAETAWLPITKVSRQQPVLKYAHTRPRTKITSTPVARIFFFFLRRQFLYRFVFGKLPTYIAVTNSGRFVIIIIIIIITHRIQYDGNLAGASYRK